MSIIYSTEYINTNRERFNTLTRIELYLNKREREL